MEVDKQAISILDIETTTSLLEINDPITHEPMGLVIELRPPSDPELIRINKKYTRLIRDNLMRRKPTEALESERDLEYLSTAVKGWQWNNATLGGTTPLSPVEFNKENVVAVLSAPKLDFIRRQIDTRMAEDGAFLGS